MKIFSVHDSKAEAYLPPIYFKTAGEAIRAFETTVKDPKTQMHNYPQDFTLVELGDYDERTAKISMLAQPKILGNASEYAGKGA